MPPALIFLFMLANDREIMGDLVSPRWVNVLTTGIVVLLTTAGLLFGVSVLWPRAFTALMGT
jgi:Mn2+/Fe2+ NRAMP family transporter